MIMVLKLRGMLTGRCWPSRFARYALLCDGEAIPERHDAAWLWERFVCPAPSARDHCILTALGTRRFNRFYSVDAGQFEDDSSDLPPGHATIWHDLAMLESPSMFSDEINRVSFSSCVWRSIRRRARRRLEDSSWCWSTKIRTLYENITV